MTATGDQPNRGMGLAREWRFEIVIGLAAFVVLVILTSWGPGRVLPLNPANRGLDISGWWYVTRSLLEGTQDLPYRGRLSDFYYPAPYIALMLPLALAPSPQVAGEIAIVLSAAGLVAVIAGWSRRPNGGFALAWVMALSLPVVTGVFLGQLPSTLGLVAMSVAIWAQRRGIWWLVGVAAAIGLLRLAVAMPIVAILLVGAWGKPRKLAVAVLSGAAVLVPLTVIVTLWYPTWAADYARALGVYQYGPPQVARLLLGPAGPLLLEGFACALAAFWSRRQLGTALDLDRAAAALAIAAVLGNVSAAYAAAALTPGLIRLAMRPGMWPVIPFATVIYWLAAFSTFPSPLSADVLSPMAGVVVGLATIPFLLIQPRRTVEAAVGRQDPVNGRL